MSKNAKQPLENASEIIERFGGIRPMAAKIDTPVTTVQGWKKRDVIPATRREQIMTAAADNNIDLSDLGSTASVANQNKTTVKPEAKATQVKKLPRPIEKPAEKKISARSVPAAPAQSSLQSSPQSNEEIPVNDKRASQNEIFAAIEANNRKTLARSAWIACALILIAGLAIFFLFRPTMQKTVDEQQALLDEQSQELDALKAKVNQRGSFIDNVMPEGIQAGLQEQMDGLQTQARNIQNTVTQLSEQASEISSGFMGADSGPISQRLEMLEEKMASFSNMGNFGDVVERIRALEGSITGQEQLKNSVQELQSMVDGIGGERGELTNNLADAQSENSGSALSETLQGVSGNDLKAAAMLIAFSQLRDSLNREAPFENDLALLERLVSDDNVELKGAIDRLAPHADGGVLTASGLSSEFKGLTGDILAASLKGEDISFKEKMKARLNGILKVEKDGELVGGTKAQSSVLKAQKLLDEGNIQGAIAELQTLDGEAGQAAQPFIERAEVSLLAERVQQMLGENILSRIGKQIPGLKELGVSTEKIAPQNGEVSERGFSDIIPEIEGVSNLNMDEVKRNLEDAIPYMGEQEVIRDEESGVTILPKKSGGFKGFSGGN